MELRYCENCGEVIRLETDGPISLTEQFFCDGCKSESGAPSSERRAKAKAKADPLTLGELPMTNDLDLFSKNTIVRRKRKAKSSSRDAAPDGRTQSTRLRLVKPGSESHNSGEEDAAAVTEALVPLSDSAGESTSTPSWLDEAPTAQEASETGKIYSSSRGSTSPSSRANRLMFRCLHCRAPLAVRPVKKTSRLGCPKCKEVLYLTSSGRALKGSPSQSSRVGGEESIVTRSPGSVVVRKGQDNTSSSRTLRLKEPQASGSQETTQRPASKKAPPASESSHEDCSLLSVNPNADWRPERKSAFDEHRASDDPDKTMFISAEDTGTLRSIADDSLLDVEPRPSSRKDTSRSRKRPQPASRAGARASRKPPVQLPTAQELKRRTVTPAAAASCPKEGQPKTSQIFVRTLLLIALLATPIVATTSLSRSTHAESTVAATAEKDASALEGLGQIATDGLRRLFGYDVPPAN